MAEADGDRQVHSDRMAVEYQRGISVSSAVMSFEHDRLAFSLLDTPGHQDAAKAGIEKQTRGWITSCGAVLD